MNRVGLKLYVKVVITFILELKAERIGQGKLESKLNNGQGEAPAHGTVTWSGRWKLDGGNFEGYATKGDKT